MKQVFKYELTMNDHITILLPEGAKILKIDTQHGVPYIWALVDLETAPNEERIFRIAGTGHIIDEDKLGFIDTFQMDGGDLIFHVFEIL